MGRPCPACGAERVPVPGYTHTRQVCPKCDPPGFRTPPTHGATDGATAGATRGGGR